MCGIGEMYAVSARNNYASIMRNGGFVLWTLYLF